MKYIVALIFCLLLLKNCTHGQKLVSEDPHNEYPELIFAPDMWLEVEETFRPTNQTAANLTVLDGMYVCPTPTHLDRIENHRQKFRQVYKYQEDSWDCDDFAREATYFAKRWGHLNYTGLRGSVAFGSVYVRITGKYPLSKKVSNLDRSPSRPAYHVLNIYRRNDGVWFFFEPQNGNVERADSIMFEGILEVLHVEI